MIRNCKICDRIKDSFNKFLSKIEWTLNSELVKVMYEYLIILRDNNYIKY